MRCSFGLTESNPYLEDFANMEQDYEFCLEVLTKYPEAIEYVKEQTEELCLIAVHKNQYLYRYVKKPTKKIQRVVLKTAGKLVKYMDNLSDELIELALSSYGKAIKYVEQTDHRCWVALRNDEESILNITNPTKEMLMYAAKRNSITALHHMADEDVIYEAAKQEPMIVLSLRNITLDFAERLLDVSPYAISHIPNPDLDQLLEAVNKDPFALRGIKNPPLEVIMTAVKKNPFAIDYVKDQPEEACWVAIKSGSIREVKNPTEEMKVYVAKHFPARILDFQTPELCQIAFDSDTKCFSILKYQTIDMMHKMVLENPSNLRFCKNPPEEIQLLAVKSDPFVVKYTDVSDAAWLAAIKADKSLIKYRNNPTEEMLEIAGSVYTKPNDEDMYAAWLSDSDTKITFSNLIDFAHRDNDTIYRIYSETTNPFKMVRQTYELFQRIVSLVPDKRDELLSLIRDPILKRKCESV